MSHLKSLFLKESQARGFLFQASHLQELDDRMNKGPIVAYIGFDATAPSLHIGSLLQIMWLRLLQRTGHKPIVLMGDGTTRVGDPSFKDTARSMISQDVIEKNVSSIQQVFSKYLTFGDGPTDALLLRNSAWLNSLNYMDFLSTYGSQFSVNRMLSFDSVKQRMEREQSLSFLEFNYMVLQAYDFLDLFRHHNCTLQFGGSDQWGNMINGIELIRRMERKETFALTAPLITMADGRKMGKSVEGALWLNSDMLPAYDFWQFWRNVPDADVGRFLRIYTDLPLEVIQDYDPLKGSDLNAVKMILADEATRLCHGEEALARIHQTLGGLSQEGPQTFDMLKASLPHYTLKENEVIEGYSVLDALVELGFATSKGEARRLIRGGGCFVNGKPLQDEGLLFFKESFNSNPMIKITAGKKRHGLLIQ